MVIILFSLLFSIPVFANDTINESIVTSIISYTPVINNTIPMRSVIANSACFSQAETYRLTGELYKYNELVKINQQLEIQTAELSKQVDLYKQEVNAMQEKVKITEKNTEDQTIMYKDQIDSIEKLHKMKEDALQEDLKQASKPRWMAMFGSFGLGAAVTAILILVL